METKNYELFIVAVEQNSQQQEDFYNFMTTKADNCMVGAIYLEDYNTEEVEEVMANIVKEGVKASGI